MLSNVLNVLHKVNLQSSTRLVIIVMPSDKREDSLKQANVAQKAYQNKHSTVIEGNLVFTVSSPLYKITLATSLYDLLQRTH